jgi:sporulation and cell division protein SsgA
MNGNTTVSAELGLRLVVPEHGPVPLVASLSYRGDDPYAVRMAFHVGLDEPVEWIFARDLLAAGRQAGGDGDYGGNDDRETGRLERRGKDRTGVGGGPRQGADIWDRDDRCGGCDCAGEGDVQVWLADRTDSEVLNIALSSPYGEALFEAPAAEVADFIERTYRLVPPGREGDFMDMESELEELLWRP